MSPAWLDPLVEAVRTNCHVADGRHAADLTLCIYLLQMRELYRWERGIALGASLPHSEVGAWLDEREALWRTLEGASFRPLVVDDETLDAFDVGAINARLLPNGLVYGAGLDGPERPGFFLAELHSAHEREGASVRICGREHARGIFAPPAALCGDVILLRRDAMVRWLWEKFEAWGVHRPSGPFRAVVEQYRLDADPAAGIARMVDEQGETLLLHELGERRAGVLLGPAWQEVRMAAASRRADLALRAVRDHLADCMVTLPVLLQRDDAPALHFWFANLDGVRAELFAPLRRAYEAWCAGDGGRSLRSAAGAGAAHFGDLALRLIALHARDGDDAAPEIERLLTTPEAACRG